MLNIAFITDKNYLLPTIVAITSLLESKLPESEYFIYLYGIGLSEDEKIKINEISEKYAQPIAIEDIDEDALLKKYIGLKKHECCANTSSLIKFDLADLCPKDVLLYLDGDIIVKQDLSSLENIVFIEDIYAAVVKESGLLYNKNLIKQNIQEYFNSGVMLLNLKMIRRDHLSNRLYLEKMQSADNSLMDQHVFNKVFENRTIALDHKYNVLFTSIMRASCFHGITIADINNLYNKNYSSFDDIAATAAIIHYSTFDKPWKYSDVDAVNYWNEYYDKSVVSNKKLKRKKLNLNVINTLRKHKILKYFGSFLWECETKGLRTAVNDTLLYLRGLK